MKRLRGTGDVTNYRRLDGNFTRRAYSGAESDVFGFGREDFSWIFSEAAHCDSRGDSRRVLALHTQDPPQPYTLRRYRFSMFATVIVLLEES